MDLNIRVNGEDWALDVAPADVLLDVLRERIGIKSPKIGCERGDCGSCTILMDGRTVRSCLVLAVEADGHEVTTVEGISYDGISELQTLFLSRTTRSSAASALPASSSRPQNCSTTTRTPHATTFRKPLPAISAAAPATSRSSMPCLPRVREARNDD